MARRERITKTVVDGLKPGPKTYMVWDTDPKRFGIRVRTTGIKVYLLLLRVDGIQRWYTIGQHGDWTPDTAREEARRVIGQAENVKKLRETGAAPANLRHPVEARESGKSRPTLAEFAKRYLEEYAEPHKGADTVEGDRGLLGLRKPKNRPQGKKDAPPKKTRTILGELGALRIDRIPPERVAAFHVGWQSTPYRANRALALLSHMYTMAETWGLMPNHSNPCANVKRFREMEREHYLDPAELVRLGKALADAERAKRLSLFALAAIRLLIFTGARASQILRLTWDRVNLQERTISVPPKKKGRRELVSVHLSAPAVELLANLPRWSGNPHVIVGGVAKQHLTLSGLEQVWQEVRTAAGLTIRLHDLRHSFASIAAAGKASLPIIGGLLGHTQPATTARYVHLFADPLKATVGAVGVVVDAAMKGKKQPTPPNRAKVASIADRRRR